MINVFYYEFGLSENSVLKKSRLLRNQLPKHLVEAELREILDPRLEIECEVYERSLRLSNGFGGSE